MEKLSMKSVDKINKNWKLCWIFSILIMVLASALQHFLFDWTHCPFIGLWSPVGESLAEHDKLMFYPMLIWWIVLFYAFKNDKAINPTKWFIATGFAPTLALSLMTIFYCTFFLGLNLPQKLALHIFFEIIAFILTQIIAYHVYMRVKPSKILLGISIGQACVVIILMAVFTFYPPNNPVFWFME